MIVCWRGSSLNIVLHKYFRSCRLSMGGFIKGHGQSNLRMRLFLFTIVMLLLHEVLPALANVQYGGCFARSCRVFWLYVYQVINFCVRRIIRTVFVCICTTMLVQMSPSFLSRPIKVNVWISVKGAVQCHLKQRWVCKMHGDIFERKWLQRTPVLFNCLSWLREELPLKSSGGELCEMEWDCEYCFIFIIVLPGCIIGLND